MTHSAWRHSFKLKLAAAALLAAQFDRLFYDDARAGWTVGLFALAWAAAAVIVRPALRRGSPLIAASIALLFAAVMVDDPSLLAWSLFWSALTVAALLPRTVGFDDAYHWAARLALHILFGPIGLAVDIGRFVRLRARTRRFHLAGAAAVMALPLLGTAIFAGLFAAANPLVARAFAAVELPAPWRVIVWAVIAVGVWPAFRPRAFVTRAVVAMPEPEVRLPGTSLPSVRLALILFNAVFAIENGLDVAFLWSGAPLPAGTTMAGYAHRGAYPLIMTALLAGFLVIAMLRPGTATARNATVRRLVVLWVAQNLLLVASSALRTIDYVAVSMLTAWRIAALIWMGLVALGLVLICWRMVAGRSARWLINANALAAGLALTACSVVDIHAVAATWNVDHASEARGGPTPLDLCYLGGMGASALVPLARLERRPLPARFSDRLRWVRQEALDNLIREQVDWHGWTWRGARRLGAATALLGAQPPAPRPIAAGEWRRCDGTIMRPDPQPTAQPAPAQPTVAPTAANTNPLTPAPAR